MKKEVRKKVKQPVASRTFPRTYTLGSYFRQVYGTSQPLDSSRRNPGLIRYCALTIRVMARVGVVANNPICSGRFKDQKGGYF
jgi:hypothetical protein